MTTFTFQAYVENFNTNLWKFHFKIPLDIANTYIEKKSKRLLVTINGELTIQAGIMSAGENVYFINLNKKIRDQLKLNEGTRIDIVLNQDDSIYGMEMPEALEEVLNSDLEAKTCFDQLTPGKKRNLLYLINQTKSEEIAIRKSLIIAEHLKKFEGVIHFKELYNELKG